MNRTLGKLTAAAAACVALCLAAGCGASSSTVTDPGGGPASDPAGNPSRTPGPIDGAKVLPLISMTGAGGTPQPTATVLNTREDVSSFARQFRVPEVSARIRKVVLAAQRPGHDVVGQIVMVGCDRPPGVVVNVNKEGQVELVPGEVASPLEECLAPVTTVAIAVLPRD